MKLNPYVAVLQHQHLCHLWTSDLGLDPVNIHTECL